MATKTTKTLEPARRLSLFDIQASWIPLLEDRIAAETDPELSDERPVCQCCGGRGDLGPVSPGEAFQPCEVCEGSGRSKSPRELAIEAADLALAEHSQAEVQRVDSYIAVIGYLESAIALRRAVAQRNTTAARIMESMLGQVKATALFVMQEAGRPRLEGGSGYLLAKVNGSVAPLLITDPELVPDDCCRMEGWVRADLWELALDLVRSQPGPSRGTRINDYSMKRVPDNTAIRAKLAEPCSKCNGGGTVVVTADEGVSSVAQTAGASYEEMTCPACGGSKTAGVPGARIGERGTHLEVK